LEFVITRLLGINPDGLRFAVELLRLQQTMSGGQRFARGVLIGGQIGLEVKRNIAGKHVNLLKRAVIG